MSETTPIHRENIEGNSTEDRLYALVDSLDPAVKNTSGFKKILDATEDSGDYDKGFSSLRTFLDQRRNSLEKVTFSSVNAEYRIDAESVQLMVRDIRFAMSNPATFLGNGAVAEVFTLRNTGSFSERTICVKVVTDYQRYAEGNRMSKEVSFLDALQDLQVEGVRTPLPYIVFSGIGMDGCIMEHLEAFNFRRILESQTTEEIKDELPEGFDVKVFFRQVHLYVEQMHLRGIYHGDLHLRNLMIDRKTGLPRIIDFGKARFERELDKTKDLPDYAKSDFESLRMAEAEVEEWLAQKA